MSPYVNKRCEGFNVKLTTIVKNNFPQVEFNVAYQTPKTIASLFPFKDSIKCQTERANVIYKINCKDCDTFYIIKAKRIFSERINEHRSNKKSVVSSCKQHERNTGHNDHYAGIEVIDSGDTFWKLSAKELLKQLNVQ